LGVSGDIWNPKAGGSLGGVVVTVVVGCQSHWGRAIREVG
jgi:hypothetical protein